MQTLTLNPTDTLALAPAAGSLAATVRRLAGSAFRPHTWPSDPVGATNAAADFVCRVGFAADHDGAGLCVIGTTPRDRGYENCPSLPSRFILAAVAVADAEGVSPQPYLDRAFDLLAGLCLTRGAGNATMLGVLSQHGFGFTMPAFKRPTERRVRAAFRIDALNTELRRGFVTRPQRSLHNAALRVLASQYAAEATDSSAAPLDRARRVAAVVRLDATAAANGFGADETGEALALYARDAAATDDGSEAWARFSTAADQANPDGDSTDGEAERGVNEDATDDRRSTDKDAGGSSADANGAEGRAEAEQRKARGKALKGQAKGRSKAEQERSAAAEAAALAAGTANDIAERPLSNEGVDVAAARARYRSSGIAVTE